MALLDAQAYERKFKDAEATKNKAVSDPKPGAVEVAQAKFDKVQVHTPWEQRSVDAARARVGTKGTAS